MMLISSFPSDWVRSASERALRARQRLLVGKSPERVSRGPGENSIGGDVRYVRTVSATTIVCLSACTLPHAVASVIAVVVIALLLDVFVAQHLLAGRAAWREYRD